MVHYLDCGDLHAGFARIRCDACGTERVLAFSCKERKFCPSWLRTAASWGKGYSRSLRNSELKDLEKLFRVKVLAMLLRKKRITPALIRMLDGWRPSGFNVFAGRRTQPREKNSLEDPACSDHRPTPEHLAEHRPG